MVTHRHERTERSAFGGQQPTAVQKALAMLEAVAYLGPGATAKQIAAHTRVPPATAYRMLNFLVADGFLVRVPDLSGFALGQRTSELAYAASASAPTRTVSDVLDGMRSQTRYGLHAASFRGGTLRLVDTDPDHEAVSASTIMRNPHAHALGKLLLAFYPQAAHARSAITAHTVVDEVALRDELSTVLATEVSFENEESRIGRAALAVPVRDADGDVVGGLSVQGGAGRITGDSADLIEMLRRGADELRGLI
ncbi:MAG: IclR family transcriptional regulator C-terminal domain-containing protein [Rhodococcus sp. (in: high G+C Gram-positive bacteria)]